jgi:AraC-like DNA-binding protein
MPNSYPFDSVVVWSGYGPAVDVLTDVLSALRTGPTLCVRTDARPPWGLRFGGNQGFGFHVVVQGGCWLVSADEDPLPLQAGDVVLLPTGKEHTLADTPSTPAVPFRLDDTEVQGSRLGHQHVAGAGSEPGTVVLSGAYRMEPVRPHPLLATLPDRVHLPDRRRPGLHAAVDLLGAEVEQQEPGAEAIIASLVDALLVYILRAWQEAHPAGWSRALNDPTIGPSLDRIHRDPAQRWTVEQLAAQAGLARATFTRRFTALVGEPPLTYVTRWRMTTAARILRQQDAPLAAVARQVGYTSEFAFAKAFKREYGQAPGRYRRDTSS